MTADSIGMLAELGLLIYALWKIKLLLPLLAVLGALAAVGKK